MSTFPLLTCAMTKLSNFADLAFSAPLPECVLVVLNKEGTIIAHTLSYGFQQTPDPP